MILEIIILDIQFPYIYLYVDEVNIYVRLGSKFCIPIELLVFDKKTYIFKNSIFSNDILKTLKSE